MKKLIKKVIKLFAKKVPVPYPVFEGKLLTGRVALITGGGSGIGYSIAESFLKNGASVIITGRNIEKLKEAKKQLLNHAKENQFVKVYAMDISNVKKLEEIFNNIVEDIDKHKIDILVNNAGLLKGKNIGETEIEDFEEVINTNLKGTFFLSQIVVNYMVENKIKGNILNVASSSSLRPAVSAYTISKWGLAGLTKGMAKKFTKFGITVNGVAPGPTATPMLIKDSSQSLDHPNLPVGRYIMPEEIANIATVLVSDMGKMIVGDIVFVTGGAGVITYDDMNY